jgi:hypothetical protein
MKITPSSSETSQDPLEETGVPPDISSDLEDLATELRAVI